jgi:hypothetical protein
MNRRRLHTAGRFNCHVCSRTIHQWSGHFDFRSWTKIDLLTMMADDKSMGQDRTRLN